MSFPKGVARGRVRPEGMNKTESAYGLHLRERLHVGEIAWFRYEGVTLKLADDTRYTPDFAVMMADLTLEMIEVKGFMREDAFAKFKIAAEIYPFVFRLVFAIPKRDGGGWEVKTYGD